jgi:hypothetical protein
MTSTHTLTIPYAVARKMAVVADAAADDPVGLSRAERNAQRTVSRRLLDDCTREDVAAVFGPAAGDEDATSLTLSASALRTYLGALDTLATQTRTPYRRQACRAVFRAFTAQVDADALGLHLQGFETLEPHSRTERVFE